MSKDALLRRYHLDLGLFIIGLILSGLTAFLLLHELRLMAPWRHPVANVWVLKVGLLACAAVFPLALICGEVRGIPFNWRLVQCSFGLFGALPLIYGLRLVHQMSAGTSRNS